ncbi:23 kDa integral membrane protein-like [Panulirus ornatus]|uniref:23 kDa integral membrane protein-like n=1 Tax=Panulirus ornatus TaxID=150431 RepID=UPI003A898DFC
MACVSRCGLFVINFFIICLGLSIVGVAAAILRQNTIFGVLLSHFFYSIPLAALLGGLFLAFLGLLGCWGAIGQNSCMLKSYAVIVSVLLVGVVALGVVMLVYTYGWSAFIVAGMSSIFNNYGGDDPRLTNDLDLIQHITHCCGIYDYQDWAHFRYGNGTNVADGCCRNRTQGCGMGLLQDPHVDKKVYTVGCLAFVTSALNGVCTALIILTLAIASIQFVSITWACLIAMDAKRYYKV